MSQLSISEVARQVGIRPSAIRYYEQIGILLPAQRTSGQRRYDNSVLERLALVQRARQIGFSLDEIRKLFFGLPKSMPVSKRWQKLSQRKLAELQELSEQIKTMQSLLRRQQKCCCDTLDQCGKGTLRSGFPRLEGNPLPISRGKR